MTCRKLFLKRFSEDFHFQWSNIFHMVGAPIMFIYSVGIVAFFGAFVIKDFWENTAYYWPDYYPFTGLIFIFLLLSSSGNFRTFLFEADLLYFIQAKRTLSRLRFFGFLSSTIKAIFQIIVLLVILFPVLWFSYQFTRQEIGMLLIALTAYKLGVMTIRRIFKGQVVKWLFTIIIFLGALLFISKMPPVIYGSLGLLLIIGIVLLQMHTSRSNHRFYREIEIDFMDRHKYIRLLMFLTMFDPNAPIKIEKASSFQKKRPHFLFRKSKRIFKARNKKNGLLEFYLKAFLRNQGDRSIYFRFITIPTIFMFLLPVWWFILILYLFFIFAIRTYMKGIFFKIKDHSFFHVIPADEDTVYSIYNRFMLWTTVPAMIMAGILWFLPLLF